MTTPEAGTQAKLDAVGDTLFRLASETRACWAEGWTRGTLTIRCDGQRLDYSLKNDTEPGQAFISEKLRDLIDELYVRMAQSRLAWTGAAMTTRLEGSDLTFEVSFTYQNPQPVAGAETEDLDPLRKLVRHVMRWFG